MGGAHHCAVVETVDLEQLSVGVMVELQHAPEVGVLFVSAEELALALAAYQQDGRTVAAHIVERCILVDERIEVCLLYTSDAADE